MKDWIQFKTGIIYFVLALVLIGGKGIVSAAVAGDFSSTYDGYNNGEDTDVPGHEIQVTGTLEFSGENAVNPRITISPTENTVLDDRVRPRYRIYTVRYVAGSWRHQPE